MSGYSGYNIASVQKAKDILARNPLTDESYIAIQPEHLARPPKVGNGMWPDNMPHNRHHVEGPAWRPDQEWYEYEEED